jgi:putative sterol carrier protein
MEFDNEFGERVASLAPAISTDVSCEITLAVSTGKGKAAMETKLSWRVENGALSVIDNPREPDVTLTVAPKDAEAIASGELTVPVAYMQGKLKPAGDNGLWLRMAKAAAGDRFETWRSSVAG